MRVIPGRRGGDQPSGRETTPGVPYRAALRPTSATRTQPAPAAVLPSEHREPLWPPGVLASMTTAPATEPPRLLTVATSPCRLCRTCRSTSTLSSPTAPKPSCSRRCASSTATCPPMPGASQLRRTPTRRRGHLHRVRRVGGEPGDQPADGQSNRCGGAPEVRTSYCRYAPESSTTPSPTTTGAGVPASPTPRKPTR
jgi:hypothetical protein